MTEKNETLAIGAHREHLQITREWVILFAVVSLVLIVVTSVWGALAIAGAPLWLTLPFGAAFFVAVVATMVTIRTLEYSRYSLHAMLEEWRENQECARQCSLIQANNITNVNVKGRNNTVSVNSAQTVEDVRLIPIHGAQKSARLIDGVPEADLIFFCERVPLIGHSKRAWFGQALPSGRTVNTFEIYDQLVAPLIKAGLIEGRGERSAGRLTTADSGEIKRVLGLAPGDVVKDVSPTDG